MWLAVHPASASDKHEAPATSVPVPSPQSPVPQSPSPNPLERRRRSGVLFDMNDRDAKRAPAQGGPFRLGFRRIARRRGPPGGCGSGTIRIGRALRKSASMISGLVHPSGPHRANRCSQSESSLVNRRTSRGAGPSTDATTVSSRATSSATQRRPFGSVYLAAKARRLVLSMACGRGCSYGRARTGPQSRVRPG